MKYNPLPTYSGDRANSNDVMMAAMVAIDLAASVSVRFVKSLDMISLYVITTLSLFMFKNLSRLHLLPLVHHLSQWFSPLGEEMLLHVSVRSTVSSSSTTVCFSYAYTSLSGSSTAYATTASSSTSCLGYVVTTSCSSSTYACIP